ncbi:MAG: hypothetical protein JNG89_15485 [Planctomycetaceae bacterium]|nr:hypothetical protein [Planctomycetaceae bacterium]
MKLLRECLGALREQLAEWDEDCRDEDNEDEITHEQAFRELFSGVFTADYDGAPYGSAFEALCRCLGRMLPNASFAPCRLEWFEQLDGYLESERVPLRLSDLIFRPPIEIPRPGEQPLIGHWTHADIVEAVGPLANVAATASDPDVAEALTMVADWCRVLTKSPGRMIVGFFA